MSARLPALKLILIDYFITTFTALSPILTMAISPFLSPVLIEVDELDALAKPTIMPDDE